MMGGTDVRTTIITHTYTHRDHSHTQITHTKITPDVHTMCGTDVTTVILTHTYTHTEITLTHRSHTQKQHLACARWAALRCGQFKHTSQTLRSHTKRSPGVRTMDGTDV